MIRRKGAMSSESKNDRTREAKSAARAKAAALLEQQRRRERRTRLLTWGAVGVGVVLVGGVIAGVIVANANGSGKAAATVPSSAPTSASGADSTPPWNAPADPGARAKAAGLAMLSAEGTVEHIHSHLSVT